MVDGVHDQGRGRVPGWFIRCELGEGVCDCARCSVADRASLSRTFSAWRRTNREALDFLQGVDGPPAASELGGADRESPAGGSLAAILARVRALVQGDPHG